jgi:hypothetical protein
VSVSKRSAVVVFAAGKQIGLRRSESRLMRPKLPQLVWILIAAGLAGCGDSSEKFPPACPSLAILRDAADLTRYAGASRDLTAMVLEAKISAVPARCERGKPGKVKATLQVEFDVTRGPAATGRQATIPYFLGVTEGGRVLDEQDYVLAVNFPPNVDRVHVTGDEITLQIPVSREKSAAAYSLYVGFRLTPAELSVNRQRGPQ